MAGQRCSLIMNELMGSMHGMHGTLDAELEVQRTIKRAELTAFFGASSGGLSILI